MENTKENGDSSYISLSWLQMKNSVDPTTNHEGIERTLKPEDDNEMNATIKLLYLESGH